MGTLILAALIVSGFASSRLSQQATPPQHDAHGDDLGTVEFATSCTPAAHAEFQRGVAMLHSYWFIYAGKTFRSVLEKDPGCAIAYWGLALDLLGNTLVRVALAPERGRRLEAAGRGADSSCEDRS